MMSMKKILIVLCLCGAGTAYAGYYFAPERMPTFVYPERRACGRMASLCGEPPKECEEAFSELRKMSGDDAIRKPIACMMSAGSCAESAGCIAGGGVNAVLKAGQEFLKGIGKSIGE
jgi:hypothetical protein